MKTNKLNLRKSVLFGVVCMLMANVLSTGCSKNDDGGADNKYYFRAKVNGQQYDFLHSAQFQGGGNDNKWQHITIGGYISATDFSKPIEESPHAFGFDLWNEGGDFQPGTYTQNGGGPYDDESPSSYSIDMEYHIQTADQGTIQYDARETGDFTFEILEISKSNGIKAKFKGTIAHEDDINDKKVITDGELYLPYEDIINLGR